jgi:hypothetical protein
MGSPWTRVFARDQKFGLASFIDTFNSVYFSITLDNISYTLSRWCMIVHSIRHASTPPTDQHGLHTMVTILDHIDLPLCSCTVVIDWAVTIQPEQTLQWSRDKSNHAVESDVWIGKWRRVETQMDC